MKLTREEKIRRSIELEERMVRFSAMTFRFLDSLPKSTSTRVIAFQLGKSASSIGANYHEANRAESKDDFVHKIGIALKECSESRYWFLVLLSLRPNSENVRKLLFECEELLSLLSASVRTFRANHDPLKSYKS